MALNPGLYRRAREEWNTATSQLLILLDHLDPDDVHRNAGHLLEDVATLVEQIDAVMDAHPVGGPALNVVGQEALW